MVAVGRSRMAFKMREAIESQSPGCRMASRGSLAYSPAALALLWVFSLLLSLLKNEDS